MLGLYVVQVNSIHDNWKPLSTYSFLLETSLLHEHIFMAKPQLDKCLKFKPKNLRGIKLTYIALCTYVKQMLWSILSFDLEL